MPNRIAAMLSVAGTMLLASQLPAQSAPLMHDAMAVKSATDNANLLEVRYVGWRGGWGGWRGGWGGWGWGVGALAAGALIGSAIAAPYYYGGYYPYSYAGSYAGAYPGYGYAAPYAGYGYAAPYAGYGYSGYPGYYGSYAGYYGAYRPYYGGRAVYYNW